MSFSQIIGALALVASILTAAAGYVDAINPKWAAVIAAVGAGIAAFTDKLLPKNTDVQ